MNMNNLIYNENFVKIAPKNHQCRAKISANYTTSKFNAGGTGVEQWKNWFLKNLARRKTFIYNKLEISNTFTYVHQLGSGVGKW